jgi:hypothetical protein
MVYRLTMHPNGKLVLKRFYLTFSLIFAFFLPFIKLTWSEGVNYMNSGNPDEFNYLEKLGNIQFLPSSDTIGSLYQVRSISIAFYIYLIISILFLLFALFHFYKLLKCIKSNQKISSGRLHFIINQKYTSPFSFFNFIFTQSEKAIEKTPEFIHELAHVRQLHSIDRLLVEFMVPMLWINPFIYLFKKSLIEVHEHLADSAVIRFGYEPIEYQKYLFSQLKSGHSIKMASNFNYSLTKKRITMISKNNSKRKSILLSLISFIMVVAIFAFYGFNNQKMVDPIMDSANFQKTNMPGDIPSILPLKPGGNYWIGSYYGMRKHPKSGEMKMHNGLDIAADEGTEIIAPANGLVIEVNEDNEYGKWIKIQHGNEYVTLYAHLSASKVKVGDNIRTNDLIGNVGNTGLSTRSHLHYEIRKYPDDKPVTYYNPADFIKNIREIPEKKSK